MELQFLQVGMIVMWEMGSQELGLWVSSCQNFHLVQEFCYSKCPIGPFTHLLCTLSLLPQYLVLVSTVTISSEPLQALAMSMLPGVNTHSKIHTYIHTYECTHFLSLLYSVYVCISVFVWEHLFLLLCYKVILLRSAMWGVKGRIHPTCHTSVSIWTHQVCCPRLSLEISMESGFGVQCQGYFKSKRRDLYKSGTKD